MNRKRRMSLMEIAETLEDLRVAIEELKDEEQEYYDNMPESMQYGERGERAEAAVSSLEDACDSIDNAIDSIYEAIE